MKTNRKLKIVGKVKEQKSLLPSQTKKIAPKIWGDVVKALKEEIFVNEDAMIEGVIVTVLRKMKLNDDLEMREALTLMLKSDDTVRKILNRELKIDVTKN